jgi:hypothetical protein
VESLSFFAKLPVAINKPMWAPCPCGEHTKPRSAPWGERYREERRVARASGRARRSGAVKPPPHKHGADQGATASEASLILLMKQKVSLSSRKGNEREQAEPATHRRGEKKGGGGGGQRPPQTASAGGAMERSDLLFFLEETTAVAVAS